MFKNLAIAYLVTAVLLFIGTLMPWASVLNFSVNGSETDDGKIVFVLALFVALAALLAFMEKGRPARVVGCIFSALALIVAILELVDIGNGINGMKVNTGIGLWVVVLAGILGIASTFIPQIVRSNTSV